MKALTANLLKAALTTVLLLTCASAAADTSESRSEMSKTVLGPRNIFLFDGAEALLNQNPEVGVPLTLKGLEIAQGNREKKMGHSNLCAGYLMLKQLDEALEHCNAALDMDPNYWRAYNNRAAVYLEMGRYEEAEADIERGQEIRPREKKLKIIKGLLMDETNPVRERVSVDDRRSALEGEEEQ